MNLTQLTPEVWLTSFDPATDRPNLGYVRGQRRSLMIDAGNSGRHHQQFLSLIRDTSLPDPSLCVLTHWHWDHTFAMAETPALTIACEATQRQLYTVSDWKWDEDSMQARLASGEDIAFTDHHIRLEYPDLHEIEVVPADLTFSGKLTVELGGLVCELLEMPSPHTVDAVGVWIPQAGVMFIGDAACEDFYNGYVRDSERSAQLLQFLRDRQPKWIVEGHSEPQPAEEWLLRMSLQI